MGTADRETVEVWRIIPSFPDYSCSNLGRVRRQTPGRGARALHVLKPCVTSPKGIPYHFLCLRRGGVDCGVSVASLVAEAFVGENPEKGSYEVVHMNGDTLNDRADNVGYRLHAEIRGMC